MDYRFPSIHAKCRYARLLCRLDITYYILENIRRKGVREEIQRVWGIYEEDVVLASINESSEDAKDAFEW